MEAIKEACHKAGISEGEFADYLVLNYNECFDAFIKPTIAIQAIQKFRQWDYATEGNAIECFGGTEALSDNNYYGFIFMRNGQSMQLPDGVRIGIMQEDGIALDEGITACFKSIKDDASTPRYSIVQNTEEDGSSTLEDYDNLESAMEAYNYIKENNCHKSEENDGEIIPLESGTEISMDIEWWDIEDNFLVENEGIDVPVITIK